MQPKKSLSPYGFLEQIYITSPPLHLLPIWLRRPLQCSCSSSFPASPSTTHPWYSYPFLGFISFHTTVSVPYSSPSVLFPHDSPSSFYHHPTPLVASPLPLYPISLFFPISYSSFLPQLPLSESLLKFHFGSLYQYSLTSHFDPESIGIPPVSLSGFRRNFVGIRGRELEYGFPRQTI